MIRYRLDCKDGHTFEAWFKNSAAFDNQAKRRLVTCPTCGGSNVTKALMTPNLGVRQNKRGNRAAIAERPVDAPTAAAEMQVSGPNEQQRELLGLMRKLRKEVEANADYVGPRFADEARKIHHEEAPARGIYGEATPEEVKALAEEGVSAYPLPMLPEDKN
jgi:hypothetical protein